jgi:hypothetical protein
MFGYDNLNSDLYLRAVAELTQMDIHFVPRILDLIKTLPVVSQANYGYRGQTDVSSIMRPSSTLNGVLNKRNQWKSHVMMMPMRILTNFVEYYILVVTKLDN